MSYLLPTGVPLVQPWLIPVVVIIALALVLVCVTIVIICVVVRLKSHSGKQGSTYILEVIS